MTVQGDQQPLPENHIPSPLAPWTLKTLKKTICSTKIQINTPPRPPHHMDHISTLQAFKCSNMA